MSGIVYSCVIRSGRLPTFLGELHQHSNTSNQQFGGKPAVTKEDVVAVVEKVNVHVNGCSTQTLLRYSCHVLVEKQPNPSPPILYVIVGDPKQLSRTQAHDILARLQSALSSVVTGGGHVDALVEETLQRIVSSHSTSIAIGTNGSSGGGSNDMVDQSSQFTTTSHRVQRNMCMRNLKWTIIFASVCALVVIGLLQCILHTAGAF